MNMSNLFKISAFALVASLAAGNAVAAANPAWQCKDTRDGYVFKFNGRDAKTSGVHETYGRIMEVTTIDGKKMLITEFQMQTVYRCEKVSNAPWKTA